ncbi:MerR family transcriptional regulator [Sedimentibacter hydroxybenzoicus DSM 7310]|uniref:MerR family transcriptional regulator n=1 Tax=Sedimentibacter hydroxybenzoicus DSM 7310 TaxID=1123245 RepID=A0A974GWN5_SEDHY|nr:MerR family transcriptional regulator [Sedimentibacter hydroxybenzoicus]NYB74692.1 MerR family transcriptional regulator [Sedimentibacter hydroxybenzoicus DSM 7310]
MKYKINDVSKLIGISKEAIRSYEKVGIISPKRDDSNGYRTYDIEDVGIFIRSRIYKNWGFSQLEIKKLINETNLEETIDVLTDKEQVLQDKILEEIRILNNLKKWKKRYSEIEKLMGNFEIANSPKLYKFDCSGDSGFYENEDVIKTTADYILDAPYFYSGGYFKKCDNEQNWENVIFMCIDAEDKDIVKQTISENAKIMESQNCVCTVVETNGRNIKIQDLDSLFEFIKLNKLSIEGKIMYIRILSIHKDRAHKVYTKVFVPINI